MNNYEIDIIQIATNLYYLCIYSDDISITIKNGEPNERKSWRSILYEGKWSANSIIQTDPRPPQKKKKIKVF